VAAEADDVGAGTVGRAAAAPTLPAALEVGGAELGAEAAAALPAFECPNTFDIIDPKTLISLLSRV
jgi:hypothetical protein